MAASVSASLARCAAHPGPKRGPAAIVEEMAVDVQDLIEEFFAFLSSGTEEFPWDQQDPFRKAIRDVIEASKQPEAVVTRTIGGRAVLLVVADGGATLVWADSDGTHTLYSGDLKGGLLRRTTKRVDEMRREITLRFDHERLPDNGFLDIAPNRFDRERQDRLFALLRPYSNAR